MERVKWKVNLFPIILIILTLLSGCVTEDSSDAGEEGGEQAIPKTFVNVTENINTPTTWKGDRVYIIKQWDVHVNSELNIEPGVVIKFHPEEGPILSVTEDGAIIAKGTAGKPIVFTSYKDDEHGGDTNGDGENSSPQAGNWEGIYIEGDGSVLDNCRFYYSGPDNAVEVWDSNVEIKNSVFAHNRGKALDARKATRGTIIEDNFFYDNEIPLSISSAFGVDDSNVFHNPENPSQTNTNNGIFLEYTASFRSDVEWLETEVPFVIDHNDLWVEEDASLTIGNDVIVKFKPGSQLNHYDNVVNYDGSGVLFTSYLDDEHGGDTNDDGLATMPTAGDFSINSISHPEQMWSNVHYAGEIGPQVEGPVLELYDIKLPTWVEHSTVQKLDSLGIRTIPDLLNGTDSRENFSSLSSQTNVPQDDILRLALRAELRTVLSENELSDPELVLLETADLDSVSQLRKVPIESDAAVKALKYHLSLLSIARGEAGSEPSREEIVNWVEEARRTAPVYNITPQGVILPSGQIMTETQEFYTLEPVGPSELLQHTPSVVNGGSLTVQHEMFEPSDHVDLSQITGQEEPFYFEIPVYGEGFYKISLEGEPYEFSAQMGGITYDCSYVPNVGVVCTGVGPSGETTITLPGTFNISLVNPDGVTVQSLHPAYDFKGYIYFYAKEPGLWKIKISSEVTVDGQFEYLGGVYPENLPEGGVTVEDGGIKFYRYSVPHDHDLIRIELEQTRHTSQSLYGRVYIPSVDEDHFDIGTSNALITIDESGQVSYHKGVLDIDLFQISEDRVINLIFGLGIDLSSHINELENMDPQYFTEQRPTFVYNKESSTYAGSAELTFETSEGTPRYYIGTISGMTFSHDADPGIMGYGEIFPTFDTEISDEEDVQKRFFVRYPYFKWVQAKDGGGSKHPFVRADIPVVAMENETLQTYEGYKLSFGAFEDDVEWAEFLYNLLTGDVLWDLIKAVGNAIACVSSAGSNVLACAAAACNLLSAGAGVYQAAGEDADDLLGSAYFITSKDRGFGDESTLYTIEGTPKASRDTDLSDTLAEVGDVCSTLLGIAGFAGNIDPDQAQQIFESMTDPEYLVEMGISEAEDELGGAIIGEAVSKFEGETPSEGYWIQGDYNIRRAETVWVEKIKVKFLKADIYDDRDGSWTGDGDMEVRTFVGSLGDEPESDNIYSLQNQYLSKSPFSAADVRAWGAGDVGSGGVLNANKIIFDREYSGKDVSTLYIEIDIWDDDDIAPDDEVARLSTQWDLNYALGSGIGHWEEHEGEEYYVISDFAYVRSNCYDGGQACYHSGATIYYEIWLN